MSGIAVRLWLAPGGFAPPDPPQDIWIKAKRMRPEDGVRTARVRADRGQCGGG